MILGIDAVSRHLARRASLTSETATGRVHDWLRRQAPDDLAISNWVMTEFSAALSVKLRIRQIDAAQRSAALGEFARLCTDNFAVLPVSRSAFLLAARFADQSTSGLRAGDALHLAVCAEHRGKICTLDRRLGDAARAVGVETIAL